MNQCSKHGVFLEVLGIGVLLAGPSGIGKSELALGLINRSHRLIADDSVSFVKEPHDKIIGRCPEVLQDFLEVRGLGVLNIRAMFGDSAIKSHKTLELIVQIITLADEELHNIDRLHGLNRENEILGVNVPEVTIPVTPGRNLSILVEAAVRNQALKMTGYESSHEFQERQRAIINQQSGVNNA